MNREKEGETREALTKLFEAAVSVWEAETGKVFPLAEREIYQQIAIERYIKAIDEAGKFTVLVRAFVINFSIHLGFLPSEYRASSIRAWSLFGNIDVPENLPRGDVEKLFNEITKDHGEANFWVGISYASDLKWDENRESLSNALKDRLLPRKMLLASLMLRAWCNVHLKQYDEAFKDMSILTEEVKLRTPEGRQLVEHYKGYIAALADYDIDIYESCKLVFILPDDEADEISLEPSKPTLITNEQFEKQMEMFTKAMASNISDLGGNIQKTIQSVKGEGEDIPNTSLEATRQRLIEDGKKWVDDLTDPGVLISAEAKYQTLRLGSWKIPILEFSSAVESEIKRRLIPPLVTFLSERKQHSFKLIGRDGKPHFFKGEGTSLIFIVLIFERVESNANIKDFFHSLSLDLHFLK